MTCSKGEPKGEMSVLSASLKKTDWVCECVCMEVGWDGVGQSESLRDDRKSGRRWATCCETSKSRLSPTLFDLSPLRNSIMLLFQSQLLSVNKKNVTKQKDITKVMIREHII